MRPLSEQPIEELRVLLDRLRREHSGLKVRGLTLNIAHGKPSSEQLNLSNALLSLPDNGGYITASGDDARNYGGDLRGLIELREIFSPILGVPAQHLYHSA